MKIFVAGATGAVGRRLVPLLVANGHAVVAMTRSSRNESALRAAGAEAAVADGLDRDAVVKAVARAKPDVVVHQMTGLAGVTSFKDLDQELAPTNRLRTSGVDNLIAAARAAGAERLIAQSYGLWRYEGAAGELQTEDDRHDPAPPRSMSRTLEAVRYLESAVTGAKDIVGLALRYGFFYGPGAGISEQGGIAAAVRARKMPIVGGGAGVWSFIHVDDAASATLAAIEHGAPQVYNVADDEPLPARVWLPELAKALGAPAPRRVPAWLGRMAGGESAVYMQTKVRGLSNARAKLELGWQPRYTSVREGFRTGMAADLPLPAAAQPARSASG